MGIDAGILIWFSGYLLCLAHLVIGPKKSAFQFFVLLAASLVAASATSLIAISSAALLFAVFVFALSAFEWSKRHRLSNKLHIAIWFLIGFIALVLALHILPGFDRPYLLSSSNFELRLSIDKAYGGLLILFVFRGVVNWTVDRNEIFYLLLSLLAIFSLALLFGAMRDVKSIDVVIPFIIFNVAVTCIAEEAFFRVWLHQKLDDLGINSRLAILVVGFLFALAHFHTGPDASKTLTLIFVAGLAYGFVFALRRSFTGAVLLHCAVNAIYFAFFSFPMSFHGG